MAFRMEETWNSEQHRDAVVQSFRIFQERLVEQRLKESQLTFPRRVMKDGEQHLYDRKEIVH